MPRCWDSIPMNSYLGSLSRRLLHVDTSSGVTDGQLQAAMCGIGLAIWLGAMSVGWLRYVLASAPLSGRPLNAALGNAGALVGVALLAQHLQPAFPASHAKFYSSARRIAFFVGVLVTVLVPVAV